VGPANDHFLSDLAQRAGIIVCAWGAGALGQDRVDQVLRLLKGRDLKCLGRNADGTPKHPLYLPKAATLETF
jgi:hypothetical protein